MFSSRTLVHHLFSLHSLEPVTVRALVVKLLDYGSEGCEIEPQVHQTEQGQQTVHIVN